MALGHSGEVVVGCHTYPSGGEALSNLPQCARAVQVRQSVAHRSDDNNEGTGSYPTDHYLRAEDIHDGEC